MSNDDKNPFLNDNDETTRVGMSSENASHDNDATSIGMEPPTTVPQSAAEPQEAIEPVPFNPDSFEGEYDPFHPNKKPLFNRLLPYIIALIVLLGLGAVGYFVVWPMINDSKKEHMLHYKNKDGKGQTDKEEEVDPRAELLQKAIEGNDYEQIIRLANDNYAPAYYPAALYYFENRGYEDARTWAERSIAAEEKVAESQELIERINKAANEKTPDERFYDALENGDQNAIISLAENGYAKAYYHVALYNFNKENYGDARTWAQRSIEAEENVEQSQGLLNEIDAKLNGKPNNDHNRTQYDTPTYDQPTTPDVKPDVKQTPPENKPNPVESINNTAAVLAETCFNKGEYDLAHNYALKALKAGKDVERAKEVVKKLKSRNYYYNRVANENAIKQYCPELF